MIKDHLANIWTDELEDLARRQRLPIGGQMFPDVRWQDYGPRDYRYVERMKTRDAKRIYEGWIRLIRCAGVVPIWKDDPSGASGSWDNAVRLCEEAAL